MTHIIILLCVILLIALLMRLRTAVRDRRREKLYKRPFPDEWKDYLEKHVALYRRLPDEYKEQLHGLIQVFLAEKRFEGCGGFVITDEVRVAVAAEACILLLDKKRTYYPKLSSICIYPGAYKAPQAERQGNAVLESDSVRAGESWQGGTLVLAWDYVEQALEGKSGHDVVVHEFSHQLDCEDGRADGAPVLEKRSQYARWAEVLGEEYAKLRANVEKHHSSVLDPYGATNPAEFFAVASEAFFEKAKQLEKAEPELYNELKLFYKVDPARWG